jgi:hypothetical protein
VPLFDPDNVDSGEAGALWHLADLLAECDAAKALAEKTGGTDAANKTATREKIIVGPHAGSWSADGFTEEEMESRFIEFQLTAPLEGGKAAVKSDGSFDRADETGEFLLLIRRHARQSEMADQSDLYLWFLDKIAALEQELMTRAESRACPRLLSITRQQGPAFGERKKASAQGEFLFTAHSIGWGDPTGEQ